jgi:KUP system potassium uptake protein
LILTTWRRGREIVSANRAREEGPLQEFIDELDERRKEFVRVPGTAVYLNSHAQTTPIALRANVEHNHVLHERVIIVSLETERVPHVYHADRLTCDKLGHAADGITGMTVRLGFQDAPNVPAMLKLAIRRKLIEPIDLERATYFLSQITIVPAKSRRMDPWRKRLFLVLARNAANPVIYFRLPDERTVTVGERVKL